MADEIPALLWVGEEEIEFPPLDTLDVQTRAELSDVDEVALVMTWGDNGEDMILWFDRVHAIALAGQLAQASTTPQTSLPRGHGELR